MAEESGDLPTGVLGFQVGLRLGFTDYCSRRGHVRGMNIRCKASDSGRAFATQWSYCVLAHRDVSKCAQLAFNEGDDFLHETGVG